MLKKTIEKFLRSILQLRDTHKSEVYVVGGTLRDLALDRQCSDFDFATIDASILATQYAHNTKSALVPLDTTPGRETFRVVISKNIFFDFSELQGKTIESDLNQRDFSINALATSLPNFIKGTKKYIDPHNGIDDIKNKTIRVLPGSIFSKDPLRMLRAFRFMSVLGFQIESKTLKKVKTLSPKISQVASERIWAELNLLLNTEKARPSIQAMDNCGLLKNIFPELYKSKNISSSLRILEHLDKLLLDPKQIKAKPLKEIKKSLLDKPQLIKFGSMFYSTTIITSTKKTENQRKQKRKTKIGKILSRLRASNADIDFVVDMVSCAHSLTNTNLSFTKNRIQLYQFVHQNEEILIPGLFLYLANRAKLPTETAWNIDPHAIAVRNISNFYYKTYLPAKLKRPLLNGSDIQNKLKINPSPMFTAILDKAKMAQTLGIIKTKSEAISLAKALIDPQGFQIKLNGGINKERN